MAFFGCAGVAISVFDGKRTFPVFAFGSPANTVLAAVSAACEAENRLSKTVPRMHLLFMARPPALSCPAHASQKD